MEEKEVINEIKDISFNTQEAQVLINIIDIALKTRGLELAETALYLTNKIQKAFKEEGK